MPGSDHDFGNFADSEADESEEEGDDTVSEEGDVDEAEEEEQELLERNVTFSSMGKDPTWTAFGECNAVSKAGKTCRHLFSVQSVQHRTW
jgi:hypothetical protein